MNTYVIKRLFLTGIVCLATACQSDRVEYKYPQKIKGKYEMLTEQEAKQKNDTLFDKKYLTFNINKKEEKKEQVIEKTEENKNSVSEKKPLWANTLPVLSRYPVAVHQDSFITTEWFSDPQNASRQLKINAAKTKDAVQITVLCRRKGKNGEWINQKNDEALADKIKNDIVNQSLNN
ncbi:MAG: DUF3576 domain-containing protein [Alphaproteobacteria bacterium]|nr:DUF3576 domain-containing protein [Alphaproteobacteria bacterium]